MTGASRGIGRAVALAFAELGDRVAVHYASHRSDAEATLAALPGAGHVLVQGDIADPVAAQRMAVTAEESLGGVDVLVNNAAVATSEANAHSVAEVSYEDWQHAWQQSVGVNLFGAANVTFCVARQLIDRGVAGRARAPVCRPAVAPGVRSARGAKQRARAPGTRCLRSRAGIRTPATDRRGSAAWSGPAW